MKDENLLYGSIARELEDASTIKDCISLGPPSSPPNMIAFKEILEEELTDTEEDVTITWTQQRRTWTDNG
jgi:hypothetical protein